MRRKAAAAFLAAVLVLALMPAAVLAQEGEELYYDLLAGYVDLYNENLDQVPGIVKRFFANERINFHISRGSGEEIIGVATSGACEILEFVQGELESPTILVFIDGDTIDSLMANPSQGAVVEALNELRIEGVGFFKTIKVALLNVVKTVASWFL